MGASLPTGVTAAEPATVSRECGWPGPRVLPTRTTLTFSR